MQPDHVSSAFPSDSADSSKSGGYQPWIDWLKFLGMTVILGGHSGMDSLIGPGFNPINSKQLGVAFFVLVTGFTLAQSTRSPLVTVARRYSPVFVYGLLVAIVCGCVGWFTRSDIYESNFLPFLLGINTVWENAFPANPSTWYIGTYLHLLIVWAVFLRHLRPSWMLFASLSVVEISVRAVWMSYQRDQNGYMSVTSWLPMLMAGMLLGQAAMGAGTSPMADSQRSPLGNWLNHPWTPIVAGILMVAFLVLWWQLVVSLGITKSNPFGRIPASSNTFSVALTSMAVSLEYAVYTATSFAVFYRLPCPQWIRFLSRHTLFVFLAHMPVRDVLTPIYYPWIPGGWSRQVANFFVLFVGLAWTSEALTRWFRLPDLCHYLEEKVFQCVRLFRPVSTASHATPNEDDPRTPA